MTKRKLKHKDKIIGLLVSLVFIVLIFWKLDFHELIAAFRMFDYRVLFLFVPIYVFSLYIRGVRWKYLLCLNEKLSVTEAFFTFTVGNTINSYLPARAGDFWRAFHLGGKIGESKMKILGSIILERLIDGISILLILFFAIISYFRHRWVLNIAIVSACLFFGALSLIYIVLKMNKTEYIFKKLSELPFLSAFKHQIETIGAHLMKFMSGFEVLNNPKCFFMAFIMSMLAWGFECLMTYMIILGFGVHYGISIALFTISFIALSTVIPSSSIFIGPYQYAYILALGIYNIEKEQALGTAFIHQMTIMLIITAISVIYFLKGNTSLTDIQKEIIEEEGKDD